MKILWIEDFGDRFSRSEFIEEMFGELFKDIDLSEHYNEEDTDTAGQLSRLFAEHSLHEIHVCKSYVDWKRVDAEHRGDFDIALIDINLGSYPTAGDMQPLGIDSPNFDKHAGFYIYHQLIKRGFPDDNIAFFTAQGTSLKEFTKYCGDIFLDRPAHCFQKNPTQFKQLRRWLAQKAGQQSLILRRGVIEGSRFLKAEIEATDRSELESRLIFFKATPRNVHDDPETFRREALDYLGILERSFLVQQPHENPHFFHLFIWDLAGKWEGSNWRYLRTKGSPRFETRLEERFHTTAHYQMKLLRNWYVHDLLSPELKASDVAYFFMLAMRAWLESDLNEIQKYERILSLLFTEVHDSEIEGQITSELESYLEQSYRQVRVLYTDIMRSIKEPIETRHDGNHFLATFKGLGELLDVLRKDKVEAPKGNGYEFLRRRTEEQSVRLFYQSYWHGLFPLFLRTALYANLQPLGFNLEPIGESFLAFLGRLTFTEGFIEMARPANVA
jgi:hypothetical protein